MGSIPVKLYEIKTSGSGGDVISRKRFWTDGRWTDTDHNT